MRVEKHKSQYNQDSELNFEGAITRLTLCLDIVNVKTHNAARKNTDETAKNVVLNKTKLKNVSNPPITRTAQSAVF